MQQTDQPSVKAGPQLRSPAALALALALLLSFAPSARGHCACPPCRCEAVSNREVSALASACVYGYNSIPYGLAANRTLQLMETISQASGAIRGCQLKAKELERLLDVARGSHEQVIRVSQP